MFNIESTSGYQALAIAGEESDIVPMIAGFDITVVDLALLAIFLIVLIFPLKVRLVEKNLELFLLVMGVLAVAVTDRMTSDLLRLVVRAPVMEGIVPAVLIGGLLFFYTRDLFKRAMCYLFERAPLALIVFSTIVLLGLVSSIITAMIASLFLVEIADLMPLERRDKVDFVIISCFAIGLGAVLTPLGEPLSTIAYIKLQGSPYHADFWYLFNQFGVLITLGVIACGVIGVFFVGKKTAPCNVRTASAVWYESSVTVVFVRAFKVYVLVAALLLLGAGMEAVIDRYFVLVPAPALFWLNMVSAILDNATLTAAEIAPSMSQLQINGALYGLLISGGMLIPGNIPNIISAGKLGITSAEWARLGVPLGLALNIVCFVIVFVLGINPALGI